MNFSSTLEKIENSKEFKQFKKQHPDTYLSVGFFVLDYEGSSHQQQLDYSLKNGKIFTFALNEADEVTFKEAETIKGEQQKLPKLDKGIKTDLEKIEDIIKKKMQEEKINNKINKIIAVIQKHKDKQIWNITCMLEGLSLLQAYIDSDSGEISKFEKRSLFDFVKKVK